MHRLAIFFVAVSLLLAVASTTLAATYNVVFRLKTEELYSSIDYKVDYSGATGEFLNSEFDVACDIESGLINGVTAVYDHESLDEVRFTLASIFEFEGAVDVYSCEFDAATAPDAGDFSIAVTDWHAATHSIVPEIEISSISSK